MYIDKQLLRKAKKLVSHTRNYSIAHLQRNLHIGYNCATVIMDIIQKSHRTSARLHTKKNKRLRYVS